MVVFCGLLSNKTKHVGAAIENSAYDRQSSELHHSVYSSESDAMYVSKFTLQAGRIASEPLQREISLGSSIGYGIDVLRLR